MLQRSPTYMISRPDESAIFNSLKRILPPQRVGELGHWWNIFFSIATYQLATKKPDLMKWILRKSLEKDLGKDFDIDKHFTPDYNPWDQRLCLVTNGDLFASIRNGDASVVTDHIQEFTPSGIRLRSGQELEADIVVTATGLELVVFGGIKVSIDGEAIDTGSKITYKGIMLDGLPNLISVTGYTNASWTLKADLSCDYFSRMLRYMDQHGYNYVCPQEDPTNNNDGLTIDESRPLSSGYIQRAMDILPKQGSQKPWKLYQNYILDYVSLKLMSLEDEAIEFARVA